MLDTARMRLPEAVLLLAKVVVRRLTEFEPHDRKFRFPGLDDFLRQHPRHRILAVKKLPSGQVDRPLMVWNHQGPRSHDRDRRSFDALVMP